MESIKRETIKTESEPENLQDPTKEIESEVDGAQISESAKEGEPGEQPKSGKHTSDSHPPLVEGEKLLIEQLASQGRQPLLELLYKEGLILLIKENNFTEHDHTVLTRFISR